MTGRLHSRPVLGSTREHLGGKVPRAGLVCIIDLFCGNGGFIMGLV